MVAHCCCPLLLPTALAHCTCPLLLPTLWPTAVAAAAVCMQVSQLQGQLQAVHLEEFCDRCACVLTLLLVCKCRCLSCRVSWRRHGKRAASCWGGCRWGGARWCGRHIFLGKERRAAASLWDVLEV